MVRIKAAKIFKKRINYILNKKYDQKPVTINYKFNVF